MDVVWIPFELHPRTPEEGLLLAERFGAESFRVRLDDLRERGQRFGFAYAGLERMANSHKALLAEMYAVQQQRGQVFRDRIYHAYFEEGRNIGELKVLLELGEEAGLDRKELESFVQQAKHQVFKPALKLIEEYAVNSVPTFIVADKYKVVGSDQDKALREAIEKAMRE